MTAIDSLKVRIYMSQCTILEPKLSSHKITIFEDTGEVDEEQSFKDRAFLVEEDGISTRYIIGRDPSGGSEDVLYILFNSKLLRGDYMRGITKNTVQAVYELLTAHKVVEFPYSSFLASRCVDVDFKTDFPVSCAKVISNTLKWLKKQVKASKRLEAGIKFKDNNTDRMIQFSTRQGATPAHPFCKFYDKQLESKSKKSIAFFDKFFPEGVPNVLRFEWTLKNKKHARDGWTVLEDDDGWPIDFEGHFGNLRLSELLDIPQDIHDKLNTQVLNRHIMKGTKQMKDREGLSPVDQFIYNAVVGLKDSFGVSLTDCVSMLCKGMDKHNKYLYKKKIVDFYTEDLTPEESTVEFEQLDILDKLGVV